MTFSTIMKRLPENQYSRNEIILRNATDPNVTFTLNVETYSNKYDTYKSLSS